MRAALSEKAKDRNWRIENIYILPAVGLVLLGLWLWIPTHPPIKYSDARISPSKVAPGDTLTAIWRFEADTNRVCSAQIVFDIVDGRLKTHRVDSENRLSDVPLTQAPPGSYLAVRIPLPFDAQFNHPGNKFSELVVTRVFQCWPFYGLWPITMPQERIPFEITDSAASR